MKKLMMTAAAAATFWAGASYAEVKPAGEPKDAAAMMMVDSKLFVSTVTSSNEFEVKSSELAKTKSQSADVKAFADQMIADHTKAAADLQKVAGDKAATKTLAPKHAGMLKLLEGVQGQEFDMLYVDMQAGAHMEAVALFDTYSKTGDDPALTSFAKQTLPTLEMHLMHVKQLVATH